MGRLERCRRRRGKERAMLAVNTILHPTDFSERSQYAFWLACSLARDYGAWLIVLHVVAAPAVVYGEGGGGAAQPGRVARRGTRGTRPAPGTAGGRASR